MRIPRTTLAALTLLVMCSPLWAKEDPLLPRVQVTAPRTAACVTDDTDGKRASDFACLSERMAGTTAQRTPPQVLGSEAITGRPPSALGLAHREATRQRMGNTFGISTTPQRPPAPAPAPPLGGKR